MAVSAKQFAKFPKHALVAGLDTSTTLYCALLTSAWTPDQEANEFWTDIKANEVASGGGYTTNGVALTTLAVTEGTKVSHVDADDPVWSSSTITAHYAVYYERTHTTDATRILIAYVDFGANVSTTAGTFQIVLDAAGFITWTVS